MCSAWCGFLDDAALWSELDLTLAVGDDPVYREGFLCLCGRAGNNLKTLVLRGVFAMDMGANECAAAGFEGEKYTLFDDVLDLCRSSPRLATFRMAAVSNGELSMHDVLQLLDACPELPALEVENLSLNSRLDCTLTHLLCIRAAHSECAAVFKGACSKSRCQW